MADQDRWTLETNPFELYRVAQGEKVVHRGHVFPAVPLVGKFTRHRGSKSLVATLTVRMDEEEGPVPERMVIEAEPLLSRDLRELYVPMMTRLVVESYAGSVTNPSPGTFVLMPTPPDEVVELGSFRHASLDEVAEAWKEAKRLGENVGPFVADECRVSESRAYSLISAARKEGLIPKRGASR